MPHTLIVQPADDRHDKFFLWAMILLPVLALGAYIFDAYYFYHNLQCSTPSIYEGLLSTLLIVFAYLQYCVPIKSKRLLCAYYVLLWVLVEVGHIGYLLSFLYLENFVSVGVFVAWMTADTIALAALLYCRVYRGYKHHIDVENKHIFHFISRLEVILAIFIPIYLNSEFSTITRDNIAFFLLFDFFSEKYDRFKSAWIKSCLYLFVTFVTVAVATEWLYFNLKSHTFEYISEIAEFIAACFCNILIIMQFFPFHFKPEYSNNMTKDTRFIGNTNRFIRAPYIIPHGTYRIR